MPEFLLEIRSEEIPARMQARAAEDLARLLVSGLEKVGIPVSSARRFATPRRLVVVLDGVPAAQADTREERRGPRVGAPDAAINGFCASAGLTRDQLTVSETTKGAFYTGVIARQGQATVAVIGALIPEILWSFPWPKSMRWGGDFKGFASKLAWVRPIHSIIALFDGAVVPFVTVRGADPGHGLTAGDTTVGHRVMGPAPFTVTDFAHYEADLRAAHVILDGQERKHLIVTGATALATAQGLELIPDDNLLDEVAGLVEWPVPLIGRIDDEFMTVPTEVLTVTMRSHQKYFALRDKTTGKMVARFLTVANLIAKDGGQAIIAGNERVLRARLSDAKFFWDIDRQTTLESRLPRLAKMTFHAKLGSVADKVVRVRTLAGEIAALIGADPTLTDRAALLAKTDLVTGVVGEFPEVQGIMGRYYALNDGEDPTVAEAIADHWKPQGPNDTCPTAPASVAVALADKIDTLAGFFTVGEKPTGSKDPFALRRAALGVIRLILENGLRLSLAQLFAAAGVGSETAAELLDFFADRLKVALREQGLRHDLIQAVFGLGGQDDLTLLVKRVAALQSFLATEDGANLLAGVKRASNILKIEEKKDACVYEGPADHALRIETAEQALGAALDATMPVIHAALRQEEFTATMAALACLRGPIDMFFGDVTVNVPDPALRQNRLKLLAEIRASLGKIADFSQIEG